VCRLVTAREGDHGTKRPRITASYDAHSGRSASPPGARSEIPPPLDAEIVHRLQESFDIPDQASAIVEDINSELDSGFDDVHGSLNELKSQISAILAHLGLPDPVEEARARKAEAQKANQPTEAELEEALRAIERAGFKIATGPSAAPETEDEEKK